MNRSSNITRSEIFENHKTNTSLRIGISVAMIIMMLGLALFLNASTTNLITNQMQILSDINMPVSHGISRAYAIQQIQQKSFEDTIMYRDLGSQKNYEISKNQFELYNNEWNYEIKNIRDLTDTFPSYESDDNIVQKLAMLSDNLNKIGIAHVQYEQITSQVFDKYVKDQKTDPISTIASIRSHANQINLEMSNLDDKVQDLTDYIKTRMDESKQKSFTLQITIIVSTGIMSFALGYFLNLINRDLVQEVVRKTRSLQQANRKLEKMNVLKDDFINIASHELKSPLHPICGFVELAQNGDIEKDEALAGISKQARQLEEVANRILDTSRINNGMLHLSYEKFDLSNMINDIISDYRLHLDEKIKIEANVDVEINIEADRIRIGQVIRNLINNALKFTEQGIIQVTARCFAEKNSVEITVKDSGSGIHPDILPKLFNKFITKGPNGELCHGNGLGLYLSREIINAHNGQIFAHNNMESGATFKFTIPLVRQQNIRELHEMIN